MNNRLCERALVLRVGTRADRMGCEIVKLADGFSVLYNFGNAAPSLYDVCLDHMASHQGRLLLPVGTHLNPKNIALCGTLIMLFSDRKYIQARIVDSGSPYVRGMGDDQYSVPSVMRYERERLWMKLDYVENGEKFTPDGWMSDKFDGERQMSLAETIQQSRSAVTIAFKS